METKIPKWIDESPSFVSHPSEEAHAHIDQMAHKAHQEVRKFTAQKWLEITIKFHHWNRVDGQAARRRREKEMQNDA